MKTDYIRQAVRESQLKFPSITKRPKDYFIHLFFTNGNGKEFLDGNPVIEVEFERSISYIEYYKEQKSFEELKEFYFDRLAENEIYDRFNYIKKAYIRDKSLSNKEQESLFWEEAVTEINSRFDDLVTIDSVSDNELFNINYWEKEINNSDYIPYLQISPTFYQLDCINENTEINLFKIAYALTVAYKNILEKYIKDPSLLNNKKKTFGNDGTDYINVYKRDLNELTRKINYFDTEINLLNCDIIPNEKIKKRKIS